MYKKLMTERVLEKMSIDSMRHIARQLISSGADVNAEHASPLKGYTPLMVTEPDKCIACGFCATMCPDSVITVERYIKEVN